MIDILISRKGFIRCSSVRIFCLHQRLACIAKNININKGVFIVRARREQGHSENKQGK